MRMFDNQFQKCHQQYLFQKSIILFPTKSGCKNLVKAIGCLCQTPKLLSLLKIAKFLAVCTDNLSNNAKYVRQDDFQKQAINVPDHVVKVPMERFQQLINRTKFKQHLQNVRPVHKHALPALMACQVDVHLVNLDIS
ncbi:hypothetical protein FGO68_gene10381 [Halteria grandinella]|uniref:Uncharacterized protein n=1 Tax=Halteria grandinella TaxID=5974 RepID=A0A8J8P6F7_HALGN|nr:hypothetical protein FGO68_gene10381 [Halteria grandinella]